MLVPGQTLHVLQEAEESEVVLDNRWRYVHRFRYNCKWRRNIRSDNLAISAGLTFRNLKMKLEWSYLPPDEKNSEASDGACACGKAEEARLVRAELSSCPLRYDGILCRVLSDALESDWKYVFMLVLLDEGWP